MEQDQITSQICFSCKHLLDLSDHCGKICWKYLLSELNMVKQLLAAVLLRSGTNFLMTSKVLQQ